MKLIKITSTKVVSILLFASFSNPLVAQTTVDYNSGWYIGTNVGVTTINIDKNKNILNLVNPSYTDDEKDFGYKLYGGYQLNKYFALEGGYFNLGKFDYAVSSASGSLNNNTKVMGINFDAVAILPLRENFSAFGRIGVNYAQTKESFNTAGAISVTDANPEYEDVNYNYGVGLQYAITENIRIRLEAERYKLDDRIGNSRDVDLCSIGLIYKFGKTKKVAPTPKEEKAMFPTFIEEEEVFIVVTEPEAQEKIIESVTQKKIVILVFEDIHFEFDKSVLSKNAKDALKIDISDLKENPEIRMLVSGYTSQMGTEKYNQGLSERRAQSVKDYLVKENLVLENKISIIGYGETRALVYEDKPKNIHSKAAKANMRAFIKIIYK